MNDEVSVSVEDFGEQHPGLNPILFVEYARIALIHHHKSPALLKIFKDENEHTATVAFLNPDSRSADSLEREKFVEHGAIVMAGLLLAHFEGKQITRVVPRGSKVDYFVGQGKGDFRWIMEVGGTDARSLASLRNEKREQLSLSPYRVPPHSKDGFAAATRFAPIAASALDLVATIN